MKKTYCFWSFVSLLVLAASHAAAAATITVNAGGDLQSALNSAQPGDTIVLQAGATFTGNYTLPLKSGTAYITVRSSASDAQLPPAGVRMDPTKYSTSLLPKIVAAGTSPAFKTATSAHHWKLQFLEIVGNAAGMYEIVRLGTGSETTVTAQPQHIVLDRVYIHGHAKMGSRRGVAANGRNLTIRDSWISDIKSVGVDTQAICGWNGAGPFLIQNNYLSAGAENIMFGGADPVVPNLVPSDITIVRNLFTKNTNWRYPVVGTPKPTATRVTGGALTAGSYAYKVVAYRACGNSKTCNSAPSTEVKITTSATGSVKLTWSAITHPTSYRVFGRGQYWTVTQTSFVDTGAAGTAGSPPSSGTRYTVKNLLELKNARRVRVEGNRFENSWAQDQTGYAVLLMPRNGGKAPWVAVQDVTIQSNRFDRVAAGITVVGRHVVNGTVISQITDNIAIVNNLLTDVSKVRYGGHGLFLVSGDGATDVTVDHNTIIHDGPAVVSANGIGNVRFIYTNNLSKHGIDGIYGSGLAGGWASLNKYFVGAEIRRNVLAGGAASRYPADNFFPPTSEFMGNFSNPSAGDYRLGTWSPYRAAGTDGKDVGVDIAALNAAMK